jgi:hypothetical protein
MLESSEDVHRAYIDGRNEGRRDERARVRGELLALAASWRAEYATIEGEGYRVAMADRLRAALDIVCPADHAG